MTGMNTDETIGQALRELTQEETLRQLVEEVQSQRRLIDEQRQLIAEVSSQRQLIEQQQQEIARLNAGTRDRFGPKPPKPEYYKGKRDAVEINSWIDQIKRYSDFYNLNRAQTADLAVFYLSGPARDWWTNLDNGSKYDVLEDFEKFSELLKTSFYPIDHERKVMDQIEKLTQRGSVAKYVERFEHLRTQVSGVGDEMWKRYFVKNLTYSVKMEAIKFNLDHPKATLPELYLRVTAIGDAIWSHRSSKDDPMDLSHIDMKKTNGKPYAGQGQKDSKPSARSSSGESRYPKTQYPRETRTCYKCGQAGHLKRNCRSTSKSVGFNGVETREYDEVEPVNSKQGQQGSSKQDF
jgi:hypothetical protein